MPAFTRKEIEGFLPHRENSLYLIEAEIIHGQGFALSQWDHNHVVFDGHFPSLAIVPGVCLIEAAAQLSGLVIAYMATEYGLYPDFLNKIGMLAAVNKFHIKSPVYPNQCISFVTSLKSKNNNFHQFIGTASFNDKKVAIFDLIVAVIDRNTLVSYEDNKNAMET
jgi:3-hydroxyacyl-[acyl-carrier-protein] dehydratase